MCSVSTTFLNRIIQTLRRRLASLSAKLTYIYIPMICVPLIVTSIFLYSKFVQVIENQTMDSTAQLLEQINFDLEKYIKEVEKTSLMVYSDEKVQKIINESILKKNIPQDNSTILNLLYNIRAVNEEMEGISFVLKDGRTYDTNYYLSNDLQYVQDFSSWAHLYEVNKLGNIAIIVSPALNNTSYDKKMYITIIKKINDFETRGTKGYLVFHINLKNIYNICNNKNFSNKGDLYLIDANRTIVYTKDKEKVASRLELPGIGNLLNDSHNKITVNISGKQMLLVSYTSQYLGLELVGIIPTVELGKGAETIRIVVVGVVIFCLVFSLAASMIISVLISKPIRTLERKMKLVGEGNFDMDFLLQRKDELGRLSYGINKMLEKIKDYIVSEVENEKKMHQSIIRQREAEFEVLQNQINPHFLYNTLDSIRMQAIVNKDPVVAEMVGTLGSLFRISTSSGKRLVLIQDEIKHVELYLKIQKFRYRDKLEVSMSAEDDILLKVIPRFTLQPIIENAITHGIQMKSRKGIIIINIREVDGDIKIQIEDNGIGIEKEKLEDLNKSISSEQTSDNKSIGIKNVDERIKLYFGKGYGLKISSTVNIGTKVEILIPKVDAGEGSQNV